MRDLRYALRTLAKSPGFTAVAILSLGLGIGANAAVYSAIRAILLDPLPVRAPEELFEVGWTSGTIGRTNITTMASQGFRDERSGKSYSSNVSHTLYRALQEAASGAAGLTAFSYVASDVSVAFAGQPVVASGLLVSGNFFDTLGVPTIVGRPLNDLDDRPDAPPAAVITHKFWVRAFGGDHSVLGRPIRFNGAPFTIVGVTTPAFYGLSKGGFVRPSDVFVPLAAHPLVYARAAPEARSLFAADDKWWLRVLVRVPSGPELTRLEVALNAAFRRTLADWRMPNAREKPEWNLRLFPAARGVDVLTRNLRQPLLVLGGVVVVVLLIACVNVANLMLARGVARQKEMSIRLALGSSRWQLLRGLLAECAIIAAAGGAIGAIAGVWGGRVLLAMLASGAGTTALRISVDGQLLAAMLAASFAAALLFGAAPALRLVRGRFSPTLKAGAAASNVPRFKAGSVLMIAQVAISVPLLVGSALFLRTIHNLAQVELGFNPERLLLFTLDPALNGYGRDRIDDVYSRVLQRLESVPGVTAATLTDIVLLSRLQNNWRFRVEGSEPTTLKFARVGPAYFDAVGVPILAGRGIGVQDHAGAPRVAILNESAARTLFGADAPIGRRIAMQSNPPVDFEIVGVAMDSRYTSPREPMPPIVYLPYAQTVLGRLGPMNVVVRSAVAPAALAASVRAAVADVDRDLPVIGMKTQAQQIDETLSTERTFMRLLIAFGAFALILASIGLHGLTAYSVARRTSEIGVRVALGARRGDVLWLILRQVGAITVAGLAVGIPAAYVAARLVEATLYGVAPSDPFSHAAAAVVMTVVAGAAALVPARRAAGLDPLRALRYD